MGSQNQLTQPPSQTKASYQKNNHLGRKNKHLLLSSAVPRIINLSNRSCYMYRPTFLLLLLIRHFLILERVNITERKKKRYSTVVSSFSLKKEADLSKTIMCFTGSFLMKHTGRPSYIQFVSFERRTKRSKKRQPPKK